MKIENQIARSEGPARHYPSLFKLMTPAEARRARRVAYEAALAVIG
jgi:hypothetical protein